MLSTPELGRTLGRYELLRRIATGGMAEVYLARVAGIARFEKLVVIKRMLPHLARDPSFVEMFLAEARIAARLDHPNIVRVEDIGEDDGNYFLVMEYVRGTDLLRMMQALSRQHRTVPVEQAVAITAGVCAGLACAHELADADGNPLALVHRDVSLPNILVSYDGAVKLADFGVAQVADRQKTRAGVLKGKLGYMSPEQCRGRSLDLRSDIFSLGIVLYEITTGKRVFAGDNDFAVMEKVVECQVPPPSSLVFDYPRELEAIVMTALQREREDRYQTARDMQCDLEAFLRANRMAGSSTGVGELVHRVLPPAKRSEDAVGRQSGEELVIGDTPPLTHASSPAAMPAQPSLAPPAVDLTPVFARRGAIALAAAAVLLGIAVCVWAALRTQHDPDELPPVATPAPSSPEITISSTRWEHGVHRDAAPEEPPARTAPAVVAAREPAREEERPAKAEPMRSKAAPVRAAVAPVRRVASPPPRPRSEPEPRARIEQAKPVEVEPAKPAPAPAPPPDAAVAVVEPPPPPPAPHDAGTPDAAVKRPVVVEVGSLDATPRITAFDVRGPLPGSAVRPGVERILPAVRACYHAAAKAKGATVPTTVQLAFEIGETRVATAIRASGGLPGMAGCVRDAAAQVRSRVAPDVGDANVTITLELVPR